MKYKFGSNYVPSGIVIYMKEEGKNIEVIEVIDADVDYLGNVIQDHN